MQPPSQKRHEGIIRRGLLGYGAAGEDERARPVWYEVGGCEFGEQGEGVDAEGGYFFEVGLGEFGEGKGVGVACCDDYVVEGGFGGCGVEEGGEDAFVGGAAEFGDVGGCFAVWVDFVEA